MMRITTILAVLVLVTATVIWVGCADEPAAAQHGAAPTTPPTPLMYRGLSIQVASGYKPIETYMPLIREIVGLGANTVLLSVAGYMEHAHSQSIYIDARKVPAPEDFKQIIRETRAMGLHVILMPIVLLRNPRGSEWRGVIEPPDWTDWWTQYDDFVLYFADIAREGGADAFIVGSELVSTEKKYTDEWVKLIAQVRERAGGARLGYSANWDHYEPVKFWDHLDFIGMTSYYTLASREEPTVDEIMDRWKPIRDAILAWQAKIGKPLVLTEVGWCSQEGAAKAPWNYYQNQHPSPAGLEEQRRLYEAFIRVWDDTPALAGVIWWEWTAAAGGPADFGYTPRNKPAEQVLRQWFAEHSDHPASAPATTQPVSGDDI